MTPLSLHPKAHRKDIDTWNHPPADIPCQLGGFGTESVMALLMRLYAYFFSHYMTEAAELHILPSHIGKGTADLKARLMMSGPYHGGLKASDSHLRPNALTVKPVPRVLHGCRTPGWFILWPGAVRERFITTGCTQRTFWVVTRHISLPFNSCRGRVAVLRARIMDRRFGLNRKSKSATRNNDPPSINGVPP